MKKQNEPMPSKEGLRKAIQRLNDLRKRKPSDELVQIIKDVTEENYPDHPSKDDIAADSHLNNPKDIGV